MKQLLPLLTFLALGSALSAQNLTFQPERPMPGETVQFRYNPAGTPLEGVETIYASALLFAGERPDAVDVELKAEGDAFVGEIPTGTDIKALFVKIENEAGDKTDSNDDQGYSTMFYRDGRSTPVQGAYGSLAQALNSFAYYAGVKRAPEKALEFYQMEFQQYPASRADKMFANDFAGLAAQNKDEAALRKAKDIAGGLAGNNKASEEEWNVAYYMFKRMKEEALANELAEKIKKKYPDGLVIRDELFTQFYEEKDLAQKEAIYQAYQEKYGKEANFQQSQTNFARVLANSFASKENWDKFNHYMSLIDDRQTKASILNDLAWSMAGEGLEGEASGLERASQFSKQSLELIKESMKKPEEGKASFYSPRYWERMLESNYGMYADTYALACYRQGAYENALKYQTIACENRNFSDGELNERYAIYYEQLKGGKAAEKKLARFIQEGQATSKMKEQHKRLFLANNSLEDAYSLYVAELEKAAQEQFREETRKKMINQEAPDFALLNLDGETVKLSELKGKTVVLDFWATWCGPCKASFPGMQRAVNHFGDDESVVFLFIDTWENEADKEKNAADFIASKAYAFEVLMDNDNKVVAQYGVQGIPTKFVIGPDGRIRFKSVGFGGNDEELLTEMKTMIEMAAAEGRKAVP